MPAHKSDKARQIIETIANPNKTPIYMRFFMFFPTISRSSTLGLCHVKLSNQLEIYCFYPHHDDRIVLSRVGYEYRDIILECKNKIFIFFRQV